MRSIALLAIFFAILPLVFYRAHIGIYLWTWFGYMNPHRLTWGIAYSFPFAQLTAVATLIGFFFTREKAKIPVNALTVSWILFIVWMNVTTLLSLDSEASAYDWDRTMKIQLFAVLSIVLIDRVDKLKILVLIVALSIGFYGAKGGVFSILTGAQNRVWGPPGSFMEDNNAIALAFVMTIPLQWFLFQTAKQKWQRIFVSSMLLLTILATLTTHSRGALLGLVTIIAFWLRQQRKLWVGVLALIIMAPALFQMMPENWRNRMNTISTYEQDASAMGRITAWQFAYELAIQRPIGGGFGAFTEENYRRYSPEISAQIDERDGRYQNAHSIYFSVLGEHGFPGLVLFLLIGYLSLSKCRAVERSARSIGDTWSANLASSLYIGLMGYAVCGAFLNLAYFDLFYQLIAMIVILDTFVRKSAAQPLPEAEMQPGPARIRAGPPAGSRRVR